MSIREEFEKARFERRISRKEDNALWAAQWMAEKCANIANRKMAEYGEEKERVEWACAAQEIKLELRQLSKELYN